MENVKELVKEIKTNLSQKSSSQKDEVKVMKAMLNDREYKVGVYGKDGLEGTLCPAAEAREMVASVISSAAKIPAAEAQKLADDHEFKKSEAVNMINVSKEFVNTYLGTGRKLPLGGRETSDVSLIEKEVKESTRTYPSKVGVNEDGSARYENVPTSIKPHTSVRVISSCPDWVK
jgi:hypothetical protein